MVGDLHIGVDGGGSGTRARLRDARGRLLGEAQAGPGNVRRPDAIANILAACRAAIAAAGLGETALPRVHAGFGVAGTQQPHDLEATRVYPWPFARVVVETDAYAAWLGAFGGEDGAILILGTGSAGLAVADGVRTTVGGWGFEVGDYGSGAVLGRAAVRRAILALDGMAERTAFAETILADFDGRAENAIIWAGSAAPADYAAYATRAFAAATAGDRLAVEVVREAAAGATLMIRRLGDLGGGRIARIGSLWEGLLPWLDDDVRAITCAPAADALDGAILLARGG